MLSLAGAEMGFIQGSGIHHMRSRMTFCSLEMSAGYDIPGYDLSMERQVS